MLRMGFHSKWINTIMHCLTSVTYSIRINGVSHGHITPTRGLRQGDPLSPYLFLLGAEGLSSLIRKAALEEKINAYQFVKGDHKYHTCSLQMIACFFARQHLKSVVNLCDSYKCMNLLQANNSIRRRLRCSSAETLLWIHKRA